MASRIQVRPAGPAPGEPHSRLMDSFVRVAAESLIESFRSGPQAGAMMIETLSICASLASGMIDVFRDEEASEGAEGAPSAREALRQRIEAHSAPVERIVGRLRAETEAMLRRGEPPTAVLAHAMQEIGREIPALELDIRAEWRPLPGEPSTVH